MDPLTILEDHFEASYVDFGSILALDATFHHSLTNQSTKYQSNSINLLPQGNDSSDNEEYNVIQDHLHFHGYETTPSSAKADQKFRHVRLGVYDYYEDISPGGKWDEEKQMLRFQYKCRHFSHIIGIFGKNTSNLNKHQKCCVGRFSAWESNSPGSIDPTLGARMASEESGTLLKDLVKALAVIQVSFLLFGSDRLQSIMQCICPTFPWPKRRQIASMATHLYFKHKQKLIETIQSLPSDTTISSALDFWTAKDQSQSYMANVIQWINPLTYTFHKKLLCFDTMGSPHSGANLAWTFWESLGKREMLKLLFSITGNNAANNISMVSTFERKYHGINITWPQEECFHRCACHVLNLVSKEFLAHMGQLTDEDYAFFDDYLAVHLAPIANSKDEEYQPPRR
ncbi:hypothetical protein O181_006390 [Austropuccinia psidii MF-1]|uniref:HAT C-terminal dimerisation domain-containing protein n=1 Tax=Austropuccinia psidii MF-1 TaxID=1389203 RepID=A0A9Q3GGT3_9BASI|nr:hypothetical protein [Austropuccinia psidii MF-1]